MSDCAILVGNRAGVVEWANPAWTRMTGFPLVETVAKPITHFLDQASIELDLVDFVGQHFLDGRPCTIEFPFETFDERTIRVHLEVQPLRNTQGEISEFVAIATDVSERHARDLESIRSVEHRWSEETISPSTPREASRLPAAHAHRDRVSLSAETLLSCERLRRLLGPRTHLDVCLEGRLPAIATSRILLEELTGLLLRAAAMEADESWGFVTVMTGRTRVGRSFVSAAHPVTVRPKELAGRSFLFLEVHDTGPTLTPEALEMIRNGGRTEDLRVHALVTAAALASALGGSLHVDSTPGCGTQALTLLPID